MFVVELQRHLAVCGAAEVDPITRRDPGFWNIVSIHDPLSSRQPWPQARNIHYACFHDAELAPSQSIRLMDKEDIAKILRFVDMRPAEPLLIHCQFGVSRSTAVALTLLVRGLFMDGFTDVIEPAVDTLLAIRSQASPNGLVLKLGLETFMAPEQAREMTVALINHPRLAANAAKNRLKP